MSAEKTTAGSGDTDPAQIPGDVSEHIFWDVADRFIQLANDQSENIPAETINAALLYAASRYSAFLAVNQQAGEDDAIESDTAVDYFTLQFRKLLEENLGEYTVPAVTGDESG